MNVISKYIVIFAAVLVGVFTLNFTLGYIAGVTYARHGYIPLCPFPAIPADTTGFVYSGMCVGLFNLMLAAALIVVIFLVYKWAVKNFMKKLFRFF